MNREEKAAVIDEVAEAIGSAEAIFAVDYRGITVAQVADLRTKLRSSNTKLRVVKNSLSERAADQAGAQELKSLLVGPTALAFVGGDPAQAAKTLSDTARALRLLEFKGGLLNGSLLSPGDVQSIARLPSREVLYAQLVGTVAAPLSGLVRTLNALIAGLAIQLGAIAEQGLVGGAVESSATADASEAPELKGASAAPAATEDAETPVVADAEAAVEPESEVATEEAQAPSPESEPTEGTSDDGPSDV